MNVSFLYHRVNLFLTTSLRPRLSNTVPSSCTQASWSGLLEWSSNCPLSWSVTSGSSTSRQSAARERKEIRYCYHTHIHTSRFNGVDLTNLHVGVMRSWIFSPCVKCHYVVFEPWGLLPGCLKRSLSTILHMQPSFWRTSWESGMLSMNFASRTLERKWKGRAWRAAVTMLTLFTCSTSCRRRLMSSTHDGLILQQKELKTTPYSEVNTIICTEAGNYHFLLCRTSGELPQLHGIKHSLDVINDAREVFQYCPLQKTAKNLISKGWRDVFSTFN